MNADELNFYWGFVFVYILICNLLVFLEVVRVDFDMISLKLNGWAIGGKLIDA